MSERRESHNHRVHIILWYDTISAIRHFRNGCVPARVQIRGVSLFWENDSDKIPNVCFSWDSCAENLWQTKLKSCYLKSESVTFKERCAIFRRALDVAELPVLFLQSAGGDVDLNVETVTHSLVQIRQLNNAAFTGLLFLKRQTHKMMYNTFNVSYR